MPPDEHSNTPNKNHDPLSKDNDEKATKKPSAALVQPKRRELTDTIDASAEEATGEMPTAASTDITRRADRVRSPRTRAGGILSGEDFGTQTEIAMDARAGARALGIDELLMDASDDMSDLNIEHGAGRRSEATVDSISGSESSGEAGSYLDDDGEESAETITDSNTLTSPSLIRGAFAFTSPGSLKAQRRIKRQRDESDDLLKEADDVRGEDRAAQEERLEEGDKPA